MAHPEAGAAAAAVAASHAGLVSAAAAADVLMAAWQAASQESHGWWPWWLAAVDLPIGLLQHPAVQLQRHGMQVLHACLQQQPPPQPQQQLQGEPAQGGNERQESVEAPLQPGQQLLYQIKVGQARDALDALLEAAQQLLQNEGPSVSKQIQHTQQQQQQLQEQQQQGPKRRGWLASCMRHTLVTGALLPPLQQEEDGERQQDQRPLAARLRLLVDAVHECSLAVQ